MDDFKIKIGNKANGDPKYIRNFGTGTTNEKGEMLTNYLQQEDLLCFNTFFEKQSGHEKVWIASQKIRSILYLPTVTIFVLTCPHSTLSKFDTRSDHTAKRHIEPRHQQQNS